MKYPGHIVKMGEPDPAIVRGLAAGLLARGSPPTSPTGVFDAAFRSLVKLFQSQNVDATGRSLPVDGEVGPLTWDAVFVATPVFLPATGAAGAALGVAISQLGVMEVPLGSNRGPQVDAYQIAAGLSLTPGAKGFFWCMAFVFWCFRESTPAGAVNPFPRTAGCLDAWNRVKARTPGNLLTRAQAIANPSLVRAGMVFILDHGGGLGHTGFVRQSVSGALRTVEGNTNVNGSSNGLGVFELTRRNIVNKQLRGFIDFT